jgi:hypothetical protein
MQIFLLFGLFVSGVSVSNGGPSSSTAETAALRISSYCTVLVESYLTLHLADNGGNPIPNATLILNGTLGCTPAPPDYRVDQSMKTDADGDDSFVVVPYAKYNVTAILPGKSRNLAIVIGRIAAPMPTSGLTITLTCSLSANHCTVGSAQSGTGTTSQPVTRTSTQPISRTTSVTVAPDEFSILLGIIVIAVSGVILIAAVKISGRNRW